MLFLSRSTSLPIPKIRDIWVWRKPKGHTNCWFVMEYIPGKTWATAWMEMTADEKRATTNQMRTYVDELRQLHHGILPYLLLDVWANNTAEFNPDQYVSALHYKPCWDLRISSSRMFGPFPDVESFYHHLLEKVKIINGESEAMSLFQALTSLKPPHSPSVVFSHSDLTARNIIIHNGKISGIIDWEQSGWWPYWWEYMKALYCTQLTKDDENEEWHRFVESCMVASKEEHGIDVQIRDIEGFAY
jgi:aminoglycoside phosphotransferase (APT) family kinase protein